MPDKTPKWPLRKRMDDLRKWLRREHPEVDEMKHLDGGTPERAYWHYGYMMALRDVLNMVQGPTFKSQVLEEIAAVPIAREDWFPEYEAEAVDDAKVALLKRELRERNWLMAEIAGFNTAGDPDEVLGKLLMGREWLQNYQRDRTMPARYTKGRVI